MNYRNRNVMDILPIYSPRTSYKKIKNNDDKMIADMTLNFDKVTITLLKDQFLKKDNQLNLEEFIIIAKRHLKFWKVDAPNRDISLIRYLTYLFNEIDINGNGDMEWEEFTNYVIEKATVLKNLKSKADQVKHYIKSDLPIKARIDNIIQKAQYIPQLDKIAFFQEGSNKITFMSLSNGQISQKPLILQSKNLVVNISSVKKEKNGKVSIRKKDLVLPTNVRIIDMLYIPDKKYKVLVVSTSDGFVKGWKHHQGGFVLATQPDNEEELFQHSFSSQIYSLAWDSINEILYCGQKTGNIYMWNLKTDLEKPLYQCPVQTSKENQQSTQQKISHMITAMITMPKLQFMASGRMDGKLILWDTINNKRKWVYKQHSRGILSLAFNQTMILLFSAGFDHKICIWNPYISSLIHKIQGHLSPILSLKAIENTHQLISMDSQGIVKITDTKRFHIIYSFSVDTTNQMGEQATHKNGNIGSGVNSLLVINNPLKLIFVGKSLSIYEYDKNYNPESADENTVICCRYVKNLLSFFTPAGSKIKIWSALNGDVQKIYMDVSQNEITTFDFDFLQKRMIIGDSKGNITMHNTVNGAKMKNLTKHAGQITHLIATQNDSNVDIFISCGIDNEIRIARQTEESFEIIRTIFLRKDITVTSLTYCSFTKLLMVGSNVGTLVFYDIQTGKTNGTYCIKAFQQFTSVCKTNLPFVFVTSSSGKIIVLGTPPLPNRYQNVFTIQHQDQQKKGSILGIRFSSYSENLKYLYVCDDKMYLTCYDFGDMIQKFNNTSINKEKTQSQRKQTVLKIFQNVTVKRLWTVKAHNEPIKNLQFVKEQNLIVTSSYDKKVKIWKATTGEYLDSLQQNYSKREPNPIAYLDTRNNILYSHDRKNAQPNIKPNMSKMHFDPFFFQQFIKKEPNFTKQVSNSDWNVHISFRDLAQQQIKNFQNLKGKIREIQCNDSQQNMLQKQERFKQIQNQINQKRKILKDINNQTGGGLQFTQLNQEYTDNQNSRKGTYASQKNLKKISSNYFKRSMMKCIQNFVDKNQNNELINALKQQEKKGKKRQDFVPIYQMISTSEKTEQASKKNMKYIQELAKKQTQNIVNSRRYQKIILDREGATKVRKLCKLLLNSDRNDQRPKILMKSIQIKEPRTQRNGSPNLTTAVRSQRNFPKLTI